MAFKNSKQIITGPSAVDESLFSGVKVLDIASFIAGPAATTVLSDFGAEVIKVEKPGTGDPYRNYYLSPPNPASEENYLWQLTNRNKRSLVLDLKNPHAAEVLARMSKRQNISPDSLMGI
jgi:formyl-CoA transferase